MMVMTMTSLAHSMWFTHAVVVASVFMMLISHSESKPQLSGLPDDDAEFINLLVPGNAGILTNQPAPAPVPPISSSGNGQCNCVPIDSCCDPRPVQNNSGSVVACNPEDLLSCVDERVLIDVGVRQNSPCPDLLTMCCEKECPQPTTTTHPPIQEFPGRQPSNLCGIRNSDGFRVTISGFKENQAQFGEFPWMVAVLTQASNGYVAGGSLVHPRVVLTAAHKVHDLTDSLAARIGDWNLAVEANTELIPSQHINVEKIVIHPDFVRKRMQYNVALLILKTDAALSDTVMPICLPQSGQVFDGLNCTVTGWGKDVFGATGEYQKIMKKVTVPAVNHSQCQRMLRNTRLGPTFNLHNTFNCAGGLGEDACEGDGGSPLVCPNPNNSNEYVQMGVVAWGIGCGVVGNPGVYGSIPETVDWITKTIQNEIGMEFDYDVRLG